MPSEERRERSKYLAQQAHSIRSRSGELHRRVVGVAQMIVETEEDVARTLAYLAQTHPDRAVRLTGLSDAARANVAHERRWIEDHPLLR